MIEYQKVYKKQKLSRISFDGKPEIGYFITYGRHDKTAPNCLMCSQFGISFLILLFININGSSPLIHYRMIRYKKSVKKHFKTITYTGLQLLPYFFFKLATRCFFIQEGDTTSRLYLDFYR